MATLVYSEDDMPELHWSTRLNIMDGVQLQLGELAAKRLIGYFDLQQISNSLKKWTAHRSAIDFERIAFRGRPQLLHYRLLRCDQELG